MTHEEFQRLGVVTLGTLALSTCMSSIQSSTEQTDTTPATVIRQAPELLSAFFGLDQALPSRANLICSGAKGQDGMPVIFSLLLTPASYERSS